MRVVYRPLPAALILAILPGLAAAQGTDDGLRKIDAPRFGVMVRAPLAWDLVQWSEDDKAFVLSLPQERGSPHGYVTCQLALPPESLADYQRLNQREDEREQALTPIQRKLLKNDLETVAVKAAGQPPADRPVEDKPAEAKPGDQQPQAAPGDLPAAAPAAVRPATPQQLVAVWELTAERGPKRYEVSSRLVRNDLLYTFTLLTDEAHFAAYRADFDELLASARFSPPDTGLKSLPEGYWLQRQFLFALRLPPAWEPSFGASDRALFFARGKAHGVFADHLVVRAGPAKPLDLPALQKSVPAATVQADSAAEIVSCEIARQVAGPALETVWRTKRDGTEVTIIERRFTGTRHCYEVRVVCESATFKAQEAEIRRALASFREVAEQAPPAAL